MNNLNNLDSSHNDSLELVHIFGFLLDSKIWILTITALFSMSAVMISLSMPDIYKSHALLMPQDQSNKMSNMLNRYSDVARLAGVQIPSESTSKSQESIARIKSFDFFTNYFLPRVALEDLMAVKDWNRTQNKLIYDKKLFNPDSKKWTPEVPSYQEAYEVYKEILDISENKKTSFVSLSIKHHSPFIAKDWTNTIIEQIHNNMKEKDKASTVKSIDFLSDMTSQTNYEEIKNSINTLQQEQIKKLMMIESSADYVYFVLDAPYAPEKKYEPKRTQIVILGTLFGFIISILFSIFLKFRASSRI